MWGSNVWILEKTMMKILAILGCILAFPVLFLPILFITLDSLSRQYFFIIFYVTLDHYQQFSLILHSVIKILSHGLVWEVSIILAKCYFSLCREGSLDRFISEISPHFILHSVQISFILLLTRSLFHCKIKYHLGFNFETLNICDYLLNYKNQN